MTTKKGTSKRRFRSGMTTQEGHEQPQIPFGNDNKEEQEQTQENMLILTR